MKRVYNLVHHVASRVNETGSSVNLCDNFIPVTPVSIWVRLQLKASLSPDLEQFCSCHLVKVEIHLRF